MNKRFLFHCNLAIHSLIALLKVKFNLCRHWVPHDLLSKTVVPILSCGSARSPRKKYIVILRDLFGKSGFNAPPECPNIENDFAVLTLYPIDRIMSVLP